MKKIGSKYLITVIVVSGLFWGCGTSKTFQGGAIGTAGGGVVGGVIGDQLGNTAMGVIIGAVVGGTAGAVIGDYMDRQAAEMQNDIKGAKIERVGEGIKITFDSGILFETNSSTLQTEAKTNITNLAVILKKYPDTNILITGHTDSDGTEEYNQTLSEKRARSVSDYTSIQGVTISRLSVIGLGENEPVESNETVEGKEQNRRVEIAIFANDDLKAAVARHANN